VPVEVGRRRGAAGRGGEILKVYRGDDTHGWYTAAGGNESYTLVNVYADITPVKLALFFPGLTANVGFWATLALNIPDFSRYVRVTRPSSQLTMMTRWCR
jgi:hypothetical protein